MTLKLLFLILKGTENQSSQTYTLENAKNCSLPILQYIPQ